MFLITMASQLPMVWNSTFKLWKWVVTSTNNFYVRKSLYKFGIWHPNFWSHVRLLTLSKKLYEIPLFKLSNNVHHNFYKEKVYITFIYTWNNNFHDKTCICWQELHSIMYLSEFVSVASLNGGNLVFYRNPNWNFINETQS